MEPFIGQIQAFGFNFAPRGWAKCHGQLLPISQNNALFALIGTIYGGDGRTTFALPDLRGRVAVAEGRGPGLSDYTIGERGGQERVTLNANEIPQHNHTFNTVAEEPNSVKPSDNLIASPSGQIYSTQSNPDTVLKNSAIGNAGGSQSHNNLQPFLAINWCIALVGIFPSRS